MPRKNFTVKENPNAIFSVYDCDSNTLETGLCIPKTTEVGAYGVGMAGCVIGIGWTLKSCVMAQGSSQLVQCCGLCIAGIGGAAGGGLGVVAGGVAGATVAVAAETVCCPTKTVVTTAYNCCVQKPVQHVMGETPMTMFLVQEEQEEVDTHSPPPPAYTPPLAFTS